MRTYYLTKKSSPQGKPEHAEGTLLLGTFTFVRKISVCKCLSLYQEEKDDEITRESYICIKTLPCMTEHFLVPSHYRLPLLPTPFIFS